MPIVVRKHQERFGAAWRVHVDLPDIGAFRSKPFTTEAAAKKAAREIREMSRPEVVGADYTRPTWGLKPEPEGARAKGRRARCSCPSGR